MMKRQTRLVVCVLLVLLMVTGRARGQFGVLGRGIPGGPTVAPPSPGLLTTAHISCEGKFRVATYIQGSGGYTTPPGVHPSMRYDVDGKRHYFTMTSGANIWESVEPTLSSCPTANSATAFATAASWGTGPTGDGTHGSDWGRFPYQSGASGDGLPFDVIAGVYYSNNRWDPGTNMMLSTWTTTYAGSGNAGKPSFGASPMNFTTHTFGTYGCWTTNPNRTQPQAGTGIIFPPASWVATNSALLPSGNVPYWIVGLGGPHSGSNLFSQGPSLVLEPAPGSGNACASGGSYPIGSGAVLSQYNSNPVGPICYDAVSNSAVLGCTPTTAPTHNYSAQMAFTGYSAGEFPDRDWNPWAGHGWFNSGVMFGLDWYDDGIFHGIFVPFVVASGWQQGTVAASPAPTYNGGSKIGTFTVAGPITTHDGYSVNVNDTLWVQTCVPGVGDCSGANGNQSSAVGITNVSGSGPYTFTYIAFGLDLGSGDHVPIVGGDWHMAPQYAHGDTQGTFPRGAVRAQIIDPNEYVKVLNGTYATTDLPIYTEEIDATSLFQGMGGPSTGDGIDMGTGQANRFSWPFNVQADNDHKRILVSFGHQPCAPLSDASYNCATVYVLKVQ